MTALPVAVGFGISTPEQAAAIAPLADGVVVGSALVRLIGEKGGSGDLIPAVSSFAAKIRQAIDTACPESGKVEFYLLKWPENKTPILIGPAPGAIAVTIIDAADPSTHPGYSQRRPGEDGLTR